MHWYVSYSDEKFDKLEFSILKTFDAGKVLNNMPVWFFFTLLHES